MWYLVLGEAVVIVALWGAWRHKTALLTVTATALKSTVATLAQARVDALAASNRYDAQLSALRAELARAYEAADANATPASVAADVNRLFTR